VGGRVVELAVSTLSLMLAIAAGYAFNDVCDYAIDRARPARHPIASGRMSRRAGWAVSADSSPVNRSWRGPRSRAWTAWC
jgi:4-hydroxybenzoate polyprenyltransferase